MAKEFKLGIKIIGESSVEIPGFGTMYPRFEQKGTLEKEKRVYNVQYLPYDTPTEKALIVKEINKVNNYLQNEPEHHLRGKQHTRIEIVEPLKLEKKVIEPEKEHPSMLPLLKEKPVMESLNKRKGRK
jgi:hypothetical protein